jgi:hypothetical protein
MDSAFGFPRLAPSWAISIGTWSLLHQRVRSYEVERLFATRFLLPFPAKVA